MEGINHSAALARLDPVRYAKGVRSCAVFASLLLVACGDEAPSTPDAGAAAHDAGFAFGPPAALSEPLAWMPDEASRDPFPEHRPAVLDCPLEAFGPERESFEVKTFACAYLSVTQTSRAAIEIGDRVDVLVTFLDLTADAPASGHVALVFGGPEGEVVFDERVDIPSDPGVRTRSWLSERAWPAGTPITFHLHNHGQNTWTLDSLSVAPRLLQ